MTMRRLSALGCAAIGSALMIAACSTTSAHPSSTSSETSHYGGTFTMLWNSAGSSIDTGVDYDSNWYVLRMTNDGLMTWDQVGGTKGNDLVPDLAEAAPTPTDGGTTYTFTLRPGIKFSTGAPVEASDFLSTITREFKIPGPGVNFYSDILGGQACLTTPKTCNLSRGIVADNSARTVTFHLAAPDPNFLEELALPFAYVLPPGLPDADIGTKPLPATGPYMIQSYVPNQTMTFVRNPYFKQWSKQAQPSGYPNSIVMKIGVSDENAVTEIENGQADWMYDTPPADRLNEIATRYPGQIHISSLPIVYYMALDTLIPPFNNLDARQALNFATNRKAIVQLVGGPRLATPTCQILPPNFPGYEPNCPYTKDPGTTWTGPDMARAEQLMAASGTKGEKVTIVGSPTFPAPVIDGYFLSLLDKLGYHATLKTFSNSVEYPYVQNSKNHVQIDETYWDPDFTAASDFLATEIGCAGFHPDSTASPNLSYFCNPAIQAKTEQALKVQETDVPAANKLWAAIDRDVTAQAPQVSLYVGKVLDFVSKRVGHFEYSEATTGGFLMDQAWVK